MAVAETSAHNAKSAIRTALEKAAKGLAHKVEEFRARRRLKTLLGPLDGRQLRDIGLTGADRDAALGMPLSQSAADRLTTSALGRAGRW